MTDLSVNEQREFAAIDSGRAHTLGATHVVGCRR